MNRGPAVELLAPDKAGPENPDWFMLRSGSNISASVIAAVCGLDRRMSPFGAYFRQVLGWAREDNPEMEWGRRFEAALAQRFAEGHPELVVCPAGLYAHPDQPWQLATPDRLVFAADTPLHSVRRVRGARLADAIPLECKTTTQIRVDGWGPGGTVEIPAWVLAQLLWQMHVLGARYGWVVVLDLLSRDYREYKIPYDAAAISRMLVRAARFRRGIERNQPPPIDAHPATTAALKRLYAPELIQLDGEVEVDDTLAALYHRQRALAARTDALGRMVENRLREAMGTARRATHRGETLVTRVVFEVERVSTKRMPPRIARFVKVRYGRKSTTDKLQPPKTRKDTA